MPYHRASTGTNKCEWKQHLLLETSVLAEVFLQVVVFPRYNNAGIVWHGRIPAGSPLMDHKIERPLRLSEEEDATPEATDPVTNNPHSDG